MSHLAGSIWPCSKSSQNRPGQGPPPSDVVVGASTTPASFEPSMPVAEPSATPPSVTAPPAAELSPPAPESPPVAPPRPPPPPVPPPLPPPPLVVTFPAPPAPPLGAVPSVDESEQAPSASGQRAYQHDLRIEFS